tara:strand:+ start:3952 stop:4359 length:408 start_codon:yes stop_codon:yes gene_type:complete
MTDQEKIDVIQAQIDGEAIQSRPSWGTDWTEPSVGGWHFDFTTRDYRVYSEPKVKYVELNSWAAFKLLAKAGSSGVDAQFTDSTSEELKDSDWSCTSVLCGAKIDTPAPIGAIYYSQCNEWNRCRVTEEVFNAGI